MLILGSGWGTAFAASQPATGPAAASVGWTQLPPPSARCCSGVAFDEARQVVVLFGGNDLYGFPGDTWTWDGANWAQQLPATSPGPLYNTALAYDPDTRTTILFGADAPGWGGANATWSWDGTTWTQLFPATSPPPRADANLAYDATTHTIVLFGGCCDATGFGLSDTWTWDGTNWTQQFPAVAPIGSVIPGMAYDAATQTVVYNGGCCPQATWTWDGTNWTQHQPATQPPYGGPLAYDAATGLVVLQDQGGLTWTWDGTSWTQQSPPSSPAGRDQAMLAYDEATQRVVLFGGTINGWGQNDTWAWDGTTWTQVDLTPAARQAASLAYEGNAGTLVLFGGLDLHARALSDTWTWTGNLWTRRHPAVSPPGRFNAALAYDAARSTSVLFGGVSCPPGCGTQAVLGDTWTWDGAAWTRASPATSLSARQQAAVAYDAARQRIVLFGGKDATGRVLADTWAWDGTAWTRLAPAASPPARYGAALAFNPATRTTVLFGGCADAACGSVLGDTWTWDGTTWTQQTPAASPPARSEASAAPSAARNAAVLVGGKDAMGRVLGDTWTWDGATWTRLTGSTPHARAGAGAAYDARTGAVVLFGGTTSSSGSVVAGDAWSLR